MSNKIVFEDNAEYGDNIRKKGSRIRFDTVDGV